MTGCGSESLTKDTTAPTVSSISPANNATEVAINTSITAAFSETMDSSTITTTTFTLKDSSNNAITGTVTYSGTTATFTPSSNLSSNTTYTATITTGVKDSVGNAMTSNYTWSFTTVTAISSSWVSILSGTLFTGESGTGQTTTITLSITQSGTSVSGTWSFSDTLGRSGTYSVTGTLIGDTFTTQSVDPDPSCASRTVTSTFTAGSTSTTMTETGSAPAAGSCPALTYTLTYTKQ